MANVSLKGQYILLQEGKCYFVIDALYLDRVKQNIDSIDKSNVEEEIRARVFPYTEAPYTKICLPQTGGGQLKFEIENIKRDDDEDDILGSFSSDTGVIIFIEESILIDFVVDFDYNHLVESGTAELINLDYWLGLEKKFGSSNCALILSPGINKGFDFNGSGFYKIIL